jgi:hypothetical protein
MFELKFSTASGAFDDMPSEIARICRDTAERIERVGIDYNDPRTVLDVNGNVVGAFAVTQS